MPDHAWIAAHIPHQGSMCLLEAVQSWNATEVCCIATNHRSADHPLRAHGRLGAVCAIEYAAQAVAVHVALLQAVPRACERALPPEALPTAADIGLLASARSVQLLVRRLDDIDAPLLITATRLHAEQRGALYAFDISADRRLATGRLSLLLSAA